MPHMGWVAMNGLNDWVIVLSGELSMTSVCDVVPEPDEAVGDFSMSTRLPRRRGRRPRSRLPVFWGLAFS